MSGGGRLAALARHYALPPEAPARLEALLALLAQDPEAPSSVRAPSRAADVHVADSLSGLAVPELRAAAMIADIGAGAGFPGLVLAVARPEAEVFAVEATARKARYLERAAAAAELVNVRVIAARAEEWAAGLGRMDAVTARALASLPVLAEYAAPLLRPGGVLVAWKGARDAAEEAAGARAGAALGLAPDPVLPVRPFPAAEHRHLHVYAKREPTPPGFPRRAGMAVKRPLGSDRSRR